jgi:hypothetical protein
MYSIKLYGGVEEYIHSFLTLALNVGEWSDLKVCCFVKGAH